MATILTIGNELVSGDVPNTNGSWLARRLEGLGVKIALIAALPDDVDRIAAFVRTEAPLADVLIVTGGLGGTPDDVTRDAIADAFGVERRLDHDLARTFAPVGHTAAFAEEWSTLPLGSRALAGAPGGAPAFAIENVYVFPGMPDEMKAAFASVRDELRAGAPRLVWRRRYATTEDKITQVLAEVDRGHRDVRVGSYPRFRQDGSEVEVVIRSRDRAALEAAVAELESLLAGAGARPA
jgi:molybdenum cofactor synthesis domain-containing protein